MTTLKTLVIACCLFAMGASLGGAARAQEWTQAKSGDGIEVSTRDVPGWRMKEFRAVARVEASLSAVVALMEDVGAYPRWFADCQHAHVVKAASFRDRYVYFVNDAPFPVRDRDAVTHFVIEQDPASRAITMRLRGEPDLVPPMSGRVRVPRIEGAWTFTPIEGGLVEVVYQVRSDPGGSVPGWLANSAVADGPWRTLRGMRRMLAEGNYRAVRLRWIRE